MTVAIAESRALIVNPFLGSKFCEKRSRLTDVSDVKAFRIKQPHGNRAAATFRRDLFLIICSANRLSGPFSAQKDGNEVGMVNSFSIVTTGRAEQRGSLRAPRC